MGDNKMQAHATEAAFLQSISPFLGGFYLFVALMNLGAACYWRLQRGRADAAGMAARATLQMWLWFGVAMIFAALVPVAWSGDPAWIRRLAFPAAFRAFMDRLMGPTLLMVGSTVALGCLYAGRSWFTRPAVAWGGLNLALLCMGFSLADADFAAVVSRPDNVPIVGLIFLLGFFTWLSARKAVVNDRRLSRGAEPLEAEDNEPVLVWPDLVYIELICMVALTALLLIWSISLPAPLEAEASTVDTPNPSKAPWYFLGLQEMLLYFDPWMAGVVLPSLIIFGLCAIPYIDTNRKGNGYYTINQRRFAYLTFQFGFLVLWLLLMLIGTFFRGPNWSFFGFFETWDVHKVEALNNVQLSKRFWIDLFNIPLPEAPAGANWLTRGGYVIWRELPGILLLGLYFLVLPLVLVKHSTMFRRLYAEMGLSRFLVLIYLFLIMTLLPIKMVCRWMFNMDYFISIPEYFFNF